MEIELPLMEIDLPLMEIELALKVNDLSLMEIGIFEPLGAIHFH